MYIYISQRDKGQNLPQKWLKERSHRSVHPPYSTPGRPESSTQDGTLHPLLNGFRKPEWGYREQCER